MIPPSSPTAEISELERATHARRRRRLAELARSQDDGPVSEGLLDAIAAHSPYFRRLVDATLRDAEGDAAELPDDDELAAALRTASAVDRKRLVRRIRTARDDRAEFRAEAAFDVLAATLGLVAALPLLPACGPDRVAAVMPEAATADLSLPALARRHPDAVADRLDEELAATGPMGRVAVWSQFGGALDALASACPERLLDLLERHATAAGPPREVDRSLGRLLRADPERTVARYASTRAWRGRFDVPGPLRRAFAQVPPELRADLAAAASARPRHLARLLHALPHADRVALLTDLEARGLATEEAPAHPAVLEALPADARRTRIRRLLDRLPADADARELEELLPWPEARDAFADGTARADGDERAAAWGALARAAVRDGAAGLDDLLADAAGTSNDRDLVRHTLVSALERVAGDAWTASRLDALQALVDDAGRARDTSDETRRALARTARRALLGAVATDDASRIERAVDLVATTAEWGGWGPSPAGAVVDGRIVAGRAALAGEGVPHALDEPLRVALAPLVDRETEAGLPWTTFGIADLYAGAPHRRAWLTWPLARLGASADADIAQTAIGHLLADPRTRVEAVGEVLAADPDAIGVPAVADLVGRKRQDLLDDVLRRLPVQGRFVRRPVVPELPRPDRWLTRQVEAYAEALRPVGRPDGADASRLDRIAALPDAGDDVLARVLESAPTGGPIEAAAAAARSRAGDAPGAVRNLLPRITRAEAQLPPALLLHPLRSLPRAEAGEVLTAELGRRGARVSTRACLARAVGIIRPDGAVPLLLGIVAEPDVHRDVRDAASATLLRFAEADDAWRGPEATAAAAIAPGGTGARIDAAQTLGRALAGPLAPSARERADALVLSLLDADLDAVRATGARALLRLVTGSRAARDRAAALLLDPDADTRLVDTAGEALLRGATDEEVRRVLATVLGQLAVQSEHDGPPHDLAPSRRASSIVRRILEEPAYDLDLEDFAGAAELLAVRAPLIAARLWLAWAAADRTGPLRRAADVVRASPVLAGRVAEAVRASARLRPWCWPGDTRGEVASALVAGAPGETAEAVVALALVEARPEGGARTSVEASVVLRLRRHPDEGVVELARGCRIRLDEVAG